MKVDRQLITLDGVDYELHVRQELDAFYGASFCRTCWSGVVRYDLLPTAADAMELAGRLAREHHATDHRHTA